MTQIAEVPRRVPRMSAARRVAQRLTAPLYGISLLIFESSGALLDESRGDAATAKLRPPLLPQVQGSGQCIGLSDHMAATRRRHTAVYHLPRGCYTCRRVSCSPASRSVGEEVMTASISMAMTVHSSTSSTAAG